MSGSCAHEHVRSTIVLAQYVEYPRGPDYRIADIQIRCDDCGAVAIFQGVQRGLDPDRPMCSPFLDELRAPLVFTQPEEATRALRDVVGEEPAR